MPAAKWSAFSFSTQSGRNDANPQSHDERFNRVDAQFGAYLMDHQSFSELSRASLKQLASLARSEKDQVLSSGRLELLTAASP
jgi:hypothetical protein